MNAFACTNQYQVGLNALASGAPPPAYQWFFNGTPIPERTNFFWSATNITADLAGEYHVTASNSVAVATSQVAVVTIYPNPLRTDAGTLDSTFVTTITQAFSTASIRAMSAMRDGRIFISGEFTSVNGIPRKRIARLFPDGTLDSSFNPGSGPTAVVTALAAQDDGSVYIAGPSMYAFDGTNVPGIARLKPDGSLDLTFAPHPSLSNAGNYGYVALALLPNGQVIFGGYRLLARI